MSLRAGLLIALAALLAGVPARAEDLRSDEGVSIPVPEGWTRRTTKLGATTVLAIERVDPAAAATDPRPTIVINSLETQSITEEKAFAQTREYLPKPGEVVERPSGKYLKVDFDYSATEGSRARKVMTRLYAGLREKKLFYFILTTDERTFERDASVVDAVVDGAKFFPATPKPEAPPPAPAPAPTPKADPPATPKKPPAPPVQPKPAEPDEPFAHQPARPSEPARPHDALVHSNPADETHLSPVKPESATVGSPAVVAPPLVRQVGKTNVLGPRTLIAHDGELDSDGRFAQNLVDPAATKGWCSSPVLASGRSKRFVFDLGKSMDVARVSFDAGVPEEAGFEGSGAREVAIQGSSQSDHGPWRELGKATLEKGKNDQPVDLPANETRWLRVEILSNHGHPTLTQLMKLRAFAAELTPEAAPGPAATVPTTTDEGPFRLERLRLTKDRSGTPVEPAVFAPGDAFWVYFKPRALRLDAKGEYGLEVDLKLEDATGSEKLSWPKVVDHKGKPPRHPYSPYVSLKVELPANFPEGRFVVRVTVRDKEAGARLEDRLDFEVKKSR